MHAQSNDGSILFYVSHTISSYGFRITVASKYCHTTTTLMFMCIQHATSNACGTIKFRDLLAYVILIKNTN